MKTIYESKVYKETKQSSIYADIYYHGTQTPVIYNLSYRGRKRTLN